MEKSKEEIPPLVQRDLTRPFGALQQDERQDLLASFRSRHSSVASTEQVQPVVKVVPIPICIDSDTSSSSSDDDEENNDGAKVDGMQALIQDALAAESKYEDKLEKDISFVSSF